MSERVGGGSVEALFRLLVGTWRARGAGLLEFTPEQSRAFFAWVGNFYAVEVPEVESVLVGPRRSLEWREDSILGATLAQIDVHGLDRLELSHIAGSSPIPTGSAKSPQSALCVALQ